MEVLDNVPLAAHTTLGLGGPARYWTDVTSEAGIPEAFAWAEKRRLEPLPWGAGSNILAADCGFDGLVLHMVLRGVDFLPAGRVLAAAGEGWDSLVTAAVARGWAGMECLSGIPGSVGAAPVQNVGAYGQEVSQSIVRVRAWDRHAHAFVELAAPDCAFAYRSSRFNGADRSRFLITAVEFQLRPAGAPALRYPELLTRVPPAASLAEVRAAVLTLRRGKSMLLDPADPDARSAGSFFKNPVLSAGAGAALTARSDGAMPPLYPQPGGNMKTSAAWLIEHSGFAKGFQLPESGIRLSRKHVLALVNAGSGTAGQAAALARHIRAAVEARWSVRLELEPVAVGFSLGELG
ncbi:MAG: UDP-N-acetylmuramate dehydrogenase [Terriglobales bacterium]